MTELGFGQRRVTVFCDRQSTVQLSKYQVFHEISKHKDARLHFEREIIETGAVRISNLIDATSDVKP